MVIQPLSTHLIKPNFCFDLSHRRSTTVSLETRNSCPLSDVDDVVVEEISLELREVLEETIVGLQSAAANLLVV